MESSYAGLPIPIPIPVILSSHMNTLTRSDYLDNIDLILKNIANPNAYDIDKAIEMSRVFSLPATVNSFRRRATKCILNSNGVEEVIKMKEELMRRGFDILRKDLDTIDTMFMKMSRKNDIWDMCNNSHTKIAKYVAAVQAISTRTPLPPCLAKHILNIAFT